MSDRSFWGPSRASRSRHLSARPGVEPLESREVLSATGLLGQYFDNADFTDLKLTRTDATVDLDWGAGSPDASIGADTFSVRWSGQLEPRYNETYTFTTTSDDGVRLWIDGRLIIDNWTDHAPAEDSGTIDLIAGRKVDVLMEYYENGGGAAAWLEWASASQAREVVPEASLTPSARGSILREYWLGVPGTTVSSLTASPDYPDAPSGASYLTSFQAPGGFGDNYGSVVRGYLHAPTTGTYELYIAGDDNCELWLANDKDPANAQRVAFVRGWTGARQWDKYGAEQQAVVTLVAGQTYYIEARHKEGRLSDHLAVGWKPPGSTTIEVIPGSVLSPVLPGVRLYVDQSASYERNGAAGAFTVVRDTDLGRDLVVSYLVTGAATAGDDYAALPGTVTIPAGQRSASFQVTPVDDTAVEGPESVTVTLLADARYTLGTPSSRAGTVTLYDDDHIPAPADALTSPGAPGNFTYSGAAGSRTVVSVTEQSFIQASRVVTNYRPANDYDVRLQTQALAPIAAGDTLLLTFWARNDGAGTAQVRAVYERAGNPYTKSLSSTVTVTGSTWQKYELAFKAAETYDGATLRAQLFFALGFDPQTVEIGGVTLVNYGPTVSVEDLRTGGQIYQGRGGAEAAWRDGAEARIEEHRMADLTVQVLGPDGLPVEGAVVQVRQLEHGFGFGSAVAADGINNTHPVNGPNYRDTITSYFNKVVLENDLKWPSWQSDPAKAIGAIDWLNANGITDVRGHNLIWPGWQRIPASPGNTYGGINYRSDPNKPDSQEEYEAHVAVDGRPAADAWLRQRVLDHIAEEAGHPQLAGRLRDWDVVNEPYSNHDVQDRLSPTYGVDSRYWLVEWFQAARQADPYARLFLNDYPSLAGGAHLESYYATVEYLVNNGAPLDGIGFQGHFGRGTPGMDAMLANLDRFAAFGAPLQITEFDQESLDLQLQADFLRDFMTLAFSHPGMDAFVMWGFWQGRHWRPDAALWRTDWSIKPNGQQFVDLVMAEWHTNVTGSTFADGLFRTRGYLGEYEVVVVAGGQTITRRVQLPAGGAAVVVALG